MGPRSQEAVRLSGECRITHLLLPETTNRAEDRILHEDESDNLCSDTVPSPCSRRQNYFSDLLNTLDAVVIGVTLLIALTYILYDKKFLRDIPRYETRLTSQNSSFASPVLLGVSFVFLCFLWFYLIF